jgi:hypothetical protein
MSKKRSYSEFADPTSDVMFKKLMSHDIIRNSFLSELLHINITKSKILDGSLNSKSVLDKLYSVVNADKLLEFLEDIKNGSITITRNNQVNSTFDTALTSLANHFELLQSIIPEQSRNTQLDLICELDHELINVEVQVVPQDFWDIRILSHVCGLFSRQFVKGFDWKELKQSSSATKVKRVIGVSIFKNPPKCPESITDIHPWYKMEKFGPNEIMRHYTLRDKESSEMGGIEFYTFNLEAVKEDLDDTNDARLSWLKLFRNYDGFMHTVSEGGEQLKPLKEALNVLRLANLPSDIKESYQNEIAISGNFELQFATLRHEKETAEFQLKAEQAQREAAEFQLKAEQAQRKTAESQLQAEIAYLEEQLHLTNK